MKTLILVDLQNDFMPGGSLAVPDGNEVVPLANRLMPFFDMVIATKDFHPPNHGSFASQHPQRKIGDVITLNGIEQILWPDHCVQNQPGSEFTSLLNTSRIDHIFYKGTNAKIDSYSAFFDNGHQHSTGLDAFLKSKAITSVFLLGLATDYCVKYSAVDAKQLGLETFVIIDACRAVEIHPGDGQRAIQEMETAGINVVSSHSL